MSNKVWPRPIPAARLHQNFGGQASDGVLGEASGQTLLQKRRLRRRLLLFCGFIPAPEPRGILRNCNKTKIFIAAAIITLGILGRFLPHLWNFTPIVAISLFAGVYLGKKYAILVPLTAMLISDIFIGFYSAPIMIAVYLSFALIGFLGFLLRKFKSPETIVAASFISSTLFFLITSWAVWQFGALYSPSVFGLFQSYLAGLPFYRNALIGDLFYTVSLFGAFEFARYLIVKRKLVFSIAAGESNYENLRH